jgi:hypothetical protein
VCVGLGGGYEFEESKLLAFDARQEHSKAFCSKHTKNTYHQTSNWLMLKAILVSSALISQQCFNHLNVFDLES